MHKLLARQLRRQFGDLENVPPALSAFIESVQETYVQADDDRAMLEHSMVTVSAELIDRYARLDDAFEAALYCIDQRLSAALACFGRRYRWCSHSNAGSVSCCW